MTLQTSATSVMSGPGPGMTPAHLAAIVHLDMVGYSRLTGRDELGTFARLRHLFTVVLPPLAAEGGGRVVNTAGDSALALFPGAGAAVRFALMFQAQVAALEAGASRDSLMQFRIGVTVGDVLAEGAAAHGDGVNIAARLQAVCPPGMVCASRAVRDQLAGKIEHRFEPLGALALKNIARPVEAFVLRPVNERGRHAALRRLRRTIGRYWAAPVLLIAAAAAWPALHVLQNPSTSDPATLPAPKPAPRLSLAVLPFANLSAEAAQDYLADAVTDDLTTDLARIEGAFVIGRGSAQTYRGRAVDARRAGAELGVRYIVQGSVRRIGEGLVRVNAELTSAEAGEKLWADRFDQDIGAV